VTKVTLLIQQPSLLITVSRTDDGEFWLNHAKSFRTLMSKWAPKARRLGTNNSRNCFRGDTLDIELQGRSLVSVLSCSHLKMFVVIVVSFFVVTVANFIIILLHIFSGLSGLLHHHARGMTTALFLGWSPVPANTLCSWYLSNPECPGLPRLKYN